MSEINITENGMEVSQEGFPALGDEVSEMTPSEELQSVERLIKATIQKTKEVAEQIKKKKEMVDGVLLNDSTFQQHAEQAKEANRIKSVTKKEILKRPDVKPIAEELKELRATKKELKTDLSSYLVDHLRIGKQLTLDFGDNEEYEIIQEAKVVKRIKMN